MGEINVSMGLAVQENNHVGEALQTQTADIVRRTQEAAEAASANICTTSASTK